MSGYLGLVTSEHRNRPRFMATVAAVTDPLCGLQELLETMRAAFDVDSAVGGQLDRTGEWIGRSRHLRLELDDVYFEWGREAVGWARGSWKGLYDPETGMVRLPDETYRLLLKAKIGANRWDGTVPGAYEVWESAFADTGSLILMQDNQDMSVVIGLAGTPLDAVMRNLLLQGYLPLKPEGVRVAWYAVAPERGPLLGWNCETGVRHALFVCPEGPEAGGGAGGARSGGTCSGSEKAAWAGMVGGRGVHHAHIRYQ